MSATKLGDITITKPSGTTLTLSTGGKYVSTDVYFNISVQSGSVMQNAPTVDSSGLITATSTVSAGYVSSGTETNTYQLATISATTYTPTTSDQTIASDKYLTGAQTILGDANLLAENIKKEVESENL